MADDKKPNPRTSWFESMRDRVKSVQNEIDSLELGQTDSELAAKFRALMAKKQAYLEAIDDADKFFSENY